MDDESFWENFLLPLKEKDSSENYDAEFKTRLQTEPELTLGKNENENLRCLSRMILGQLQVQTKQTQKERKRKTNEYNHELIKTIALETQSRESSRSVNREVTPSTSVVRFGDSVPATNLANPERVNQRGSCKLKACRILGKVLRCIKYWLGFEDFKEVTDIIDLTNEETSANIYSSEEHGTKRFKNAEGSSGMHSDENDNEDTEDETELDPSQEDNLRKITGIVNKKDKIEKQKSHQQRCVSKWNLEYLKLYVKSEQVKTSEVSKVKVEQFDCNRFSDLQTSLIRRSRQLLAYRQCFDDEAESGLKLWSLQFSIPMLKEMTVSLMVFEVLCAVCQLCDVRLKPEETLPKAKGEYPNARVDYALDFKGVIFGVVEIKTPKTMTAAAVAQLLLSLLKLQNKDRQEKMQYVGILTDGFRYVLVRLEGDKFTFENDGSAGHRRLPIRRVVKWDDLHTLCGDIQSIFKSATARLEKLTKK